MADDMMNKFMDMFNSSHQWGQTSNSSFVKFLIDENEHLKAEILRLRKDAEKRNCELIAEVARLQKKMKDYKAKLLASAANHSSLQTELATTLQVPYIPTPNTSGANLGSLRTLSEPTTTLQVPYIPTPNTSAVNLGSFWTLSEPTTTLQVPYTPTPKLSVAIYFAESLYEPTTVSHAALSQVTASSATASQATVSQAVVSHASPVKAVNNNYPRSLNVPVTVSQTSNYIPTPIDNLTSVSVSDSSPTPSSSNPQPSLISNTLEYHPSPINRFRRRQGAEGKGPKSKMATVGPSAFKFKTP